MDTVEVYTAPGCASCRIAKAKLIEANIPFLSIDISDDEKMTEDLAPHQTDRIRYALSNKVPLIYVGDDLVGGYVELTSELETGVFAERLQRIGVTLATAHSGSPTSKESSRNAKITNHSLTPSEGEPLNSLNILCEISSNVSDPGLGCCAMDIATALQKSALRLLDQFASADERSIDYHRMGTSQAFRNYVELSFWLQYCDLQQLADFAHDEKVAFWANLYNALIVHAKCVLADQVQAAALPAQCPEAVAARSALYTGLSGAVYRIGGAGGAGGSGGTGSDGTADKACHIDVTPDIIEHAILRANRPHPSQVNEALAKDAAGAAHSGDGDHYYRTLTFLAADHPVVQWNLPVQQHRFDPRIHFVLNCGARSCPPIRVLEAGTHRYRTDSDAQVADAGNVEAALATATAAYLSEEVRLDEAGRVLHLPRLLLWYERDFGNNLPAVVARVASLQPPAASDLAARLTALVGAVQFTTEATVHAAAPDNDTYLVSYNPYDWASNHVGV